MGRGGYGKGSHATPARSFALETTKEVRLRGAYVRELLNARRQDSGLSDEDFAFAQVLAFGVVMCTGTLDELIDRNLNSPKDIKPKVRDCLRISAYEMLFLDKPAHVAVDQGVELVKSVAARAAGLANAVLRKMAADAAGFPWGDASEDDAALARILGVPGWLLAELSGQYGRDAASQILRASLRGAPTYLVDNPYAAGQQFASDLSAQFVASLVPVDSAVLEVGAGRGTKTLLLQKAAYERDGSPVEVHAVDVHGYRARLLRERMEQSGIHCVTAYACDARDLSALRDLPSSFASVFVDAPCSGTGTLRRHPEIRWRLTPDGVAELAELQYELLCEASTRVAQGGSLVYATCSLLDRENGGVVRRFLASGHGQGFAVRRIRVPERYSGHGTGGWRATPEGWFASVPVAGGPDGHFTAVLQRSE